MVASLELRRERAWAILLALASAASVIHPEYESDPFWHMSLGRAVLDQASRTVSEPTALSAFVRPAVVPEWLWGVVTYGLHQLGGWPLMVGWTFVLAGAAALAVVALTREFLERPSLGLTALLSGAAMSLVVLRVRLRPELVGLVLLPVMIVLARRFAAAGPGARVRLGLLAVGLEVLWAQLHGSFVLAAPAFLAVMIPTVRADAAPSNRSVALATALGLLGGVFTSAYGFGIVEYLVVHAGGDAKEHVSDMVASSIVDLRPSEMLTGGSFVLAPLALIASAGALVAKRLWPGEIGLAILGVAVGSTAIRFQSVCAVLLLPLAARGASALATWLAAPSWWRWPGVALGSLLWLAGAHRVLDRYGPFGRIGPAVGYQPEAAGAALALLPEGTEALTPYEAGGPLGLRLAGRVRTWVDGRTPLYFDDADYGIARDAMAHGAVLKRALRRFGATAMVLRRGDAACLERPESWVLVAVDPLFSTFVSPGAHEPLRALSPCGESFLRPDACAGDGTVLDHDIARTKASGDPAFARYLRAERILRCGGALEEVPGLLSDPDDARAYRPARDRALAEFLLRSGQPLAAFEALEADVQNDSVLALGALVPVLASGAIPANRARAAVESATLRLDDAASPERRALLALLCSQTGDVRCTRMQALRAAAGGSIEARPALEWLRDNDATEQGRRDAEAWLRSLDDKAAQPAPK